MGWNGVVSEKQLPEVEGWHGEAARMSFAGSRHSTEATTDTVSLKNC